ncbi:Ku protein [Streptomyces virginiae]|uniref:Ku protein n=1 Tax=Streptomyces virginiae TaxID=1961 RepID=UPI0037CD0F88
MNERTGGEVDLADIVKGYDTGSEYLIVEPQELDGIAPGRARSIDVAGCVDLGTVDPVFFDKTYFLGPRGAQYGKVHALLERLVEGFRARPRLVLCEGHPAVLVRVHRRENPLVRGARHGQERVVVGPARGRCRAFGPGRVLLPNLCGGRRQPDRVRSAGDRRGHTGGAQHGPRRVRGGGGQLLGHLDQSAHSAGDLKDGGTRADHLEVELTDIDYIEVSF